MRYQERKNDIYHAEKKERAGYLIDHAGLILLLWNPKEERARSRYRGYALAAMGILLSSTVGTLGLLNPIIGEWRWGQPVGVSLAQLLILLLMGSLTLAALASTVFFLRLSRSKEIAPIEAAMKEAGTLTHDPRKLLIQTMLKHFDDYENARERGFVSARDVEMSRHRGPGNIS